MVYKNKKKMFDVMEDILASQMSFTSVNRLFITRSSFHCYGSRLLFKEKSKSRNLLDGDKTKLEPCTYYYSILILFVFTTDKRDIGEYLYKLYIYFVKTSIIVFIIIFKWNTLSAKYHKQLLLILMIATYLLRLVCWTVVRYADPKNYVNILQQ